MEFNNPDGPISDPDINSNYSVTSTMLGSFFAIISAIVIYYILYISLSIVSLKFGESELFSKPFIFNRSFFYFFSEMITPWLSGFFAGYICSKISAKINPTKVTRLCLINAFLLCMAHFIANQIATFSAGGYIITFYILSLIMYIYVFLAVYIFVRKHNKMLNTNAKASF